jgi:hypothetical protein
LTVEQLCPSVFLTAHVPPAAQ